MTRWMTFLFADSPEFGTILASEGLFLKFPATENYLLRYKHLTVVFRTCSNQIKNRQTNKPTKTKHSKLNPEKHGVKTKS